MYELLIFAHVLGAVAWVGGGIYSMVAWRRALVSDEDGVVGHFVDTMEWAGGRVFGIAPPVTLLAGIGLVVWSGGWRFSQLWVWTALVLALATAVSGGLLQGRAGKEMRTALEVGGARSSDFADALRRFNRFGYLDLTLVLAILALMVFKPGV